MRAEAGLGEGLEAVDNNYLVSLETRISRHTWHPLFTLSTHQQRDHKEMVMQRASFPPKRGPQGALRRLICGQQQPWL